MICLKNVGKEYRLGNTRVEALRDVTLQIERGAFMCFAGASGSGKTTLLNIIGLIDRPSRGTLLLDSRDTTDLTEKERCRFRNRSLGFVFQSFNLMPVLNVYENVRLPIAFRNDLTSKEKDGSARGLVEAVGLTPVLAHRPSELSGGQRQRVAVARALVGCPKIVLADEPTANLDSKTGEEIIRLMKDINTELGTTFIFSTHDPRIMQMADRTVRIQDGEVRAA